LAFGQTLFTAEDAEHIEDFLVFGQTSFWLLAFGSYTFLSFAVFGDRVEQAFSPAVNLIELLASAAEVTLSGYTDA
jgi:hypothetical protein